LNASVSGTSTVLLTWIPSTDNVGVTGYIVRRDGVQIATAATTGYSDLVLTAGTTYTYTVAARDAAGNVSPNSTSKTVTTASGSGDTSPPSTPTGLAATTVDTSTIGLLWVASTDNVGVNGYVVRRNGSSVATVATTSFSDTGLTAGTTYRYTVAAFDAAGNNSALSASAQATTAGTPPPPPVSGAIPSTLGWYQIPNTAIKNVCPSASGFPQIQGNEGCPAVMDDWSGGIFDAGRNRMVMWGGGHGGYAGNELYALDVNTLTVSRLNDPTVVVRDGCTNNGTYADGTPVSRHTYNHLAYLPAQDAMFAWGGSRWQCGFFIADTWLFNFSTLTWSPQSNANGPSESYGRSVALDPNTGLVYARDDFELYSFNATTNAWTKRSSVSFGMNDNKTAVIDPVRKKYYLHGNSSTILYWYDISSPTGSVPIQSGQTTGCGGFIGTYQVGMEYDPVQDKIVGWAGGNTIYLLNPDTLSCTTVTFAGGPTAELNGTWGRFRYSPASNVFVTCNNIATNCYALRLTP
jgi:chitodextrinase